jgi:hypothetical protein
MSSTFPTSRFRAAVLGSGAALLSAAVLLGAFAPQAAAAQSAGPLPIPGTAVEPLVTEGVSVEGPLVNNIALPMAK